MVRHSSSTRSAASSAPNRCGPPSQRMWRSPRRCSSASPSARSTTDCPQLTTSATAARAARRSAGAAFVRQHDRPYRCLGEGPGAGIEVQRGGDEDQRRLLRPAGPGAPLRARLVDPHRSVPLVAGRTGADHDRVGDLPHQREDRPVRLAGEPARPAVDLDRAVEAGHEVRPEPRHRVPSAAYSGQQVRLGPTASARAGSSSTGYSPGRPVAGGVGSGRPVLAVAPVAAPAFVMPTRPTGVAYHRSSLRADARPVNRIDEARSAAVAIASNLGERVTSVDTDPVGCPKLNLGRNRPGRAVPVRSPPVHPLGLAAGMEQAVDHVPRTGRLVRCRSGDLMEICG